jgi:hypothetical protein
MLYITSMTTRHYPDWIKSLLCWLRGHCICTVVAGFPLKRVREYCYVCNKAWPGAYGFTDSSEQEYHGVKHG